MSVLIKGLKMPTSCLKGGCHVDGFFCRLWEDKYWASYEDPEKGRHRDCPLIEIPDHGDLIDRDALRNEMMLSESCSRCERDAYRCQYYEEMTVMDVCERIDDAPVVIQAERSEK